MSRLTAYDKFIQQALKYGFSLWGTAKTGQLTSYRTGDDGDVEKGYPQTGPRFVDNGDGTITDNATGLMWIKEPTTAPGDPFDNVMDWATSIDACNALSFAGHSDWRLPNVKELLSIVDYSEDDPSIDGVTFPNTQPENYWSSTTRKALTTAAWYVDFDEGDVRAISKQTLVPPPMFARPVRLGVPKD